MKRERPQNFEQWLASIPTYMKRDPVWKSIFYQKAMFLYELFWCDCEELMTDLRGRSIARQATDSCGSISANMEEGLGRGFGRDYARFLTIALGSAKETRGWYARFRFLLAPQVVEHRIQLCDEIIGMLLPVIKDQRRGKGS